MMHLSAGCGAAVQLLRRKHYSSARRACTASNYSERYALMAWLDPAPRMPDPVRLRVELFLFFLLQNHMVFKTLYVERAGARDAARAELEARVAAGRGPGRLARRRRRAERLRALDRARRDEERRRRQLVLQARAGARAGSVSDAVSGPRAKPAAASARALPAAAFEASAFDIMKLPRRAWTSLGGSVHQPLEPLVPLDFNCLRGR